MVHENYKQKRIITLRKSKLILEKNTATTNFYRVSAASLKYCHKIQRCRICRIKLKQGSEELQNADRTLYLVHITKIPTHKNILSWNR